MFMIPEMSFHSRRAGRHRLLRRPFESARIRLGTAAIITACLEIWTAHAVAPLFLPSGVQIPCQALQTYETLLGVRGFGTVAEYIHFWRRSWQAKEKPEGLYSGY